MKKSGFKFWISLSTLYGFTGSLYLYVLIIDNSEMDIITRLIVSLVTSFTFIATGAFIMIAYHKDIPKKKEPEGFFT